MQNLENKKRMETWKVQSSDEKGFHKVITPDTCECQEAQMFRLNLSAGESYTLESKELELHPVLLAGVDMLVLIRTWRNSILATFLEMIS